MRGYPQNIYDDERDDDPLLGLQGPGGEARFKSADSPDSEGHAEPSKFVVRYLAGVKAWRWVVLSIWALLFIIGGLFGKNLLKRVQLKFEAPDGSSAAKAEAELYQHFPHAAESVPLALVIHRRDETSVLGPDLKNYTDHLVEYVRDYANRSAAMRAAIPADAVQGYYTSAQPYPGHELVVANAVLTAFPVATVDHFGAVPDHSPSELWALDWLEAGPGDSESPFVGGVNESWGLITINVLVPNNSSLDGGQQDFAKALLGYTKSLAAATFQPGAIEIKLTGMLVFGIEVLKGTSQDLLRMEMIAFPLALAVLAVILKSFRLLMIPVISIMISIVTAYLIMWPIAIHTVVISFAPDVMMSASIAMSIDYSLFLLSRYREELIAGRGSDSAVLYMISSAGHTVLVSGATLVICFLALMFFPTAMLRSTGLGCAIAVTCTILVNLSLTPALLLAFPAFFKRSAEPSSLIARIFPGKSPEADREPMYADESNGRSRQIGSIQDGENDGHGTRLPNQAGLLAGLATVQKTRWFKFAKVVAVRRPVLTIIIVSAFAVPCAISFAGMERTLSTLTFIPAGSEGSTGFLDVSAQFGAGSLFGYYLIAKPPPGVSALSDEAFRVTNALLLTEPEGLAHIHSDAEFIGLSYVSALKNRTGLNATQQKVLQNLTGWRDDGEIPLSVYDLLFMVTKNCSDLSDFAHPPLPILFQTVENLCKFVSSQMSNSSGTPDALMTKIILREDPFREPGMKWLYAARDRISKWESANPGWKGYLGGGAATNIDVVDGVFDAFPLAIVLTACFVLVWIGISFRSILIPVRSVYTLAITICIVYGCAVYVYQDSALGWIGFKGLQSDGAVCWMPPIMCFSIVVGLGLDYDVFLICRVQEYRLLGLSTKDAVAYGLAQTGPIITAAGAIMALAFGGLLASGEKALNEMAFYLVASVLFDTLVIRSLLVPSIMVLFGEANWWPSQVPLAVVQTVHGVGQNRRTGSL